MSLKTIPVIPRTTQPAVAGTPVWYAEATSAKTQLDLSVTIPSGPSRKLVLLWGSDGGAFPTEVTFDPAGIAVPLIAVDAAFGANGNLRVGAWYLDTPPVGTKTVRIATASAVWSVASLKVLENARAGSPAGIVVDTSGGAALASLDSSTFLLDSFSETADVILASGLSDGNLVPFAGQNAGADDVVNATFLATTSGRTHANNGEVDHGWTAASSTDLLMAAVNVLFSAGQLAAGPATPLSEWALNETGLVYSDAQARSNASVVSGNVLGGQSPLLNDGGQSVSVRGTVITAGHHVDWQVRSWSAEIYLQPRSAPTSGNRAILSKDSALPVPGGWQLEMETTRAIDFYIRDETGLGGTAIHVTGASGDGELSLDTAHVIHITYDDDAKTAAIYLDRTLLATKADPNFSGLQNNTSTVSIGSRAGTAGVEFDGLIDRVTFFSGVLTASEIAARPAPTTISDPGPPSGITMQDIQLGVLPPNSDTDVDPAAYATGLGSGNRDLTEISDPAGRMSFLNDATPSAQIRITMPAAPVSTTNESSSATIAEAGGAPSNVFNITWQREGTGGGGGYTPFPFVTNFAPPVSHAGVASRPGYSPSDPRSASFIDPMSGLEVFRITATRGSTVFINGTTDSGLQFPSVLKGENNPRAQRAFNADSTLLMLSESKSTSADSQLTGPACRSALIDIDGSHGNTGPWRILRAGTNNTLNDTLPSGGNIDVQSWFWDWLNPLRAYILAPTQVYEWWPAGGAGHSVGETNFLFNGPSGYTIDFRGGRAQSSHDGLICHVPIRRNSDGMRGGVRMNLSTGALGPIVMNPRPPYASSDNELNGIVSTGALGTWCYFGNQLGTNGSANSKNFRTANMVTGDLSPSVFDNVMGHSDHMHVDGREYLFGEQGDQWISFDLITGAKRVRLTGDPLSVAHPTCRAFKDTFENHGATGGSTSGLRYALGIRSEGSLPGHIYGIRLGLNDTNVVRFICNHRSKWSNNYNEVHAHVSPDFEFVAFNSNWVEPGVESDLSHVQEYVVLIPDAWRSPNNDGS